MQCAPENNAFGYEYLQSQPSLKFAPVLDAPHDAPAADQ